MSLYILSANERDEAARYEPSVGGLNKAAFERVSYIEWNKYPYSALLVPGLGPQTESTAIEPGAIRRCGLAAELFKKGEAPYIIVSGGHVHPARTPYNEAAEMRKYLVNELGIPAAAIIIEPYARHTTTNIRNAARLILHFGIPSEKPILIATDIFQSTYIPMMKPRFLEELGYVPYKSLAKTKTGLSYFVPDISSLKLNPLDPLDP